MKILLDHNLTRKLKKFLPGHLVLSAAEEGWDRLINGDLLQVAEQRGYDVMVTADQGIFYQQNNEQRRIALVVLTSNRRPFVLAQGEAVQQAVERIQLGSFELVPIPLPPRRSATQ